MKERRELKKSPAHGEASSFREFQVRPCSSATAAELRRHHHRAPARHSAPASAAATYTGPHSRETHQANTAAVTAAGGAKNGWGPGKPPGLSVLPHALLQSRQKFLNRSGLSSV